MDSISPTVPHFTMTTDWLAFTLPSSSVHDVTQVLGGDWTKGNGGYRGYPLSWVLAGGTRGTGKIGIGAPRSPREVHVDLSAGIVSAWPVDKIKAVLQWVFDHNGHLTRIDCALDDRHSHVPIEQVRHAILAGQMVGRPHKSKSVEGLEIHKTEPTGATLYLGSPHSQTMLRIYDKRLELKEKHQANWQDYGIRWELQFRDDRANLCGRLLRLLEPEEWVRFIVSVLRGYVDFRDTSKDEPNWARCRAPLLPWWMELTNGLAQCRLTVEKQARTIEQVKIWAKQSLGPMLAVLNEAAGKDWFNELLDDGKRRWKSRHRDLLNHEESPKDRSDS
jgi:phage replication initiation protein